MYESTEQKKPKYEAKGIETVRRDGCPAVSKVYLKFCFKFLLILLHFIPPDFRKKFMYFI